MKIPSVFEVIAQFQVNFRRVAVLNISAGTSAGTVIGAVPLLIALQSAIAQCNGAVTTANNQNSTASSTVTTTTTTNMITVSPLQVVGQQRSSSCWSDVSTGFFAAAGTIGALAGGFVAGRATKAQHMLRLRQAAILVTLGTLVAWLCWIVSDHDAIVTLLPFLIAVGPGLGIFISMSSSVVSAVVPPETRTTNASLFQLSVCGAIFMASTVGVIAPLSAAPHVAFALVALAAALNYHVIKNIAGPIVEEFYAKAPASPKMPAVPAPGSSSVPAETTTKTSNPSFSPTPPASPMELPPPIKGAALFPNVPPIQIGAHDQQLQQLATPNSSGAPTQPPTPRQQLEASLPKVLVSSSPSSSLIASPTTAAADVVSSSSSSSPADALAAAPATLAVRNSPAPAREEQEQQQQQQSGSKQHRPAALDMAAVAHAASVEYDVDDATLLRDCNITGFLIGCAIQTSGISIAMSFSSQITQAAGMQSGLVGNMLVMLINFVGVFFSFFVVQLPPAQVFLTGCIGCSIMCFTTAVFINSPQIALASICGMIWFFEAAPGNVGPSFYTVMTEVFPPAHRVAGASRVNLVQFVASLLILILFPSLVSALTPQGAPASEGVRRVFVIFGAMGAAASAGLYIYFPKSYIALHSHLLTPRLKPTPASTGKQKKRTVVMS